MDKVIFWDFDGTLVYSERMWSRALYRLLKRHMPDTALTIEDVRGTGLVLYSWEEAEKDNRKLVGDAWWRYTEGQFYKMYTMIGVPEEIAFRASRDMRSEILKVNNYHLYADAHKVLDECCKRGYRNYILSNNYPELQQIMDELELTSYFSGLVISAMEGYDKPRREFFQMGLDMAGNPSHAYMVGDNPYADIEGGNQMGMTTILVHRDAPNQADYHIEELSEILEII